MLPKTQPIRDIHAKVAMATTMLTIATTIIMVTISITVVNIVN